MKRHTGAPATGPPFDRVVALGLALPGVESAVRYDGAPGLRLHGCFMAGLTAHPSAEAGTLVVRSTLEDRALLIEDAPDIYYVTDYHARHRVVLARLRGLDDAALRDLLHMSWTLTDAKARPRKSYRVTTGTSTRDG